jgi:hypothetical protein
VPVRAAKSSGRMSPVSPTALVKRTSSICTLASTNVVPVPVR